MSLVAKSDFAYGKAVEAYANVMLAEVDALQGYFKLSLGRVRLSEMNKRDVLVNRIVRDDRPEEVLLLAVAQSGEVDVAISPLDRAGEATGE